MNGVFTVRPGRDLIDLTGAALRLQERRHRLRAEEAAQRDVRVGTAQDQRTLAVAGRHRLGVTLLGTVRRCWVIAAASSSGEHLAGAGAVRGGMAADQWLGYRGIASVATAVATAWQRD